MSIKNYKRVVYCLETVLEVHGSDAAEVHLDVVAIAHRLGRVHREAVVVAVGELCVGRNDADPAQELIERLGARGEVAAQLLRFRFGGFELFGLFGELLFCG